MISQDLSLQFKDAMNAVKRAVKGAETGGIKGFRAAALVVQRRAMQRVPIEYGNLRASAYTRPIEGGAEVGFTAKYAVYVHENTEQKLKGKKRPSGLGVYWGPDGQPKFLESAVKDSQPEIIRIVVAASSAEIERQVMRGVKS
jgi:hypothetical protein